MLYHDYNGVCMKKNAFTLAEVLITLGIIGVVAALTIPTLIANHNKSVVEQKMKKFYSMINQALILAEEQHGDKKFWYQDINSVETDDEGNVVPGSSVVMKWWNKYMAPNVKTIEIKEDAGGLPTFYFEDGTALKAVQASYMRDWVFYTMNPSKCEKFPSSGNGVCRFYFIYMPGGPNVPPAYETTPDWQYHVNKGFEPYKYNSDGTREGMLNNCKSGGVYCAALIQYDGWKVSDDYPLKVK